MNWERRLAFAAATALFLACGGDSSSPVKVAGPDQNDTEGTSSADTLPPVDLALPGRRAGRLDADRQQDVRRRRALRRSREDGEKTLARTNYMVRRQDDHHRFRVAPDHFDGGEADGRRGVAHVRFGEDVRSGEAGVLMSRLVNGIFLISTLLIIHIDYQYS